jgi:RNA polymerase sigma-70 factor (ECF subfamily)
VHEALARLRARQRLVEIDAMSGALEDGRTLESESPSPEQEVMTQTIKIVLEAAVEKLPETYRSVFMMRDVEGMSTAETADCRSIEFKSRF